MVALDDARILSGASETARAALLASLAAGAEGACSTSDPNAIDAQIARMAGTRRRSERMGAPPVVLDNLASLIDALEAHRGDVALARNVQVDGAQRLPVRERVRQALSTPRRPVELAAELGVDPANVARALRELRSDGTVVEVPAELGDLRARRYVAADGLAAEIERATTYLETLRSIQSGLSSGPPDPFTSAG